MLLDLNKSLRAILDVSALIICVVGSKTLAVRIAPLLHMGNDATRLIWSAIIFLTISVGGFAFWRDDAHIATISIKSATLSIVAAIVLYFGLIFALDAKRDVRHAEVYLAIFSGALAEEVVFRGYLLGRLKTIFQRSLDTRSANYVAALASSVVFALSHGLPTPRAETSVYMSEMLRLFGAGILYTVLMQAVDIGYGTCQWL